MVPCDSLILDVSGGESAIAVCSGSEIRVYIGIRYSSGHEYQYRYGIKWYGIGTFSTFIRPQTYCQLGNIKRTVTDNQNIFELIFIRKYAPILLYISEKSPLTKLNGMKPKGLMLREHGCTRVLPGKPLATAISLYL